MRLTYNPALDGIRAVAVAGVIGYHSFGHPVGGPYGVDVFFVLSGFLITSMLAGEHQRTGHIEIRKFYGRRVWRLAPALLALLAVFAVATSAFGNADGLDEIVFPFTYTTNVAVAFGAPTLPALNHLWTLATEEQYYLLWPLMLLLMLRKLPSRAPLLIAALCFASACWRIVGYAFASDGHARVMLYFSPWPRFDGLLLGSLTGLLWTRGTLPRIVTATIQRRALLTLATVLAIGAVFFVAIDAPLWALAVATVNIAAAFLILDVTLARHGAPARLLSLKPISYMGRISYSLYLWNSPMVFLWAALPGSPLERSIASTAATFAAAACSYHLVEKPLRDRHRRASRALQPVPLTA